MQRCGQINRQFTQLWIDYSQCGTVVGIERPKSGPLGKFVPDVIDLHHDGRTITLAELIATPGHIVLAFNAAAADAARMSILIPGFGSVVTVGDEADLIDPDGHLAAAFGVQGSGLVAIRPDGYVGLIATTTEPHTLEHYLNTALHSLQPA